MSTVTLSEVTVGPLSQEFDRIFRDHYQLVYRTAYGVTGSVEDAEDVLQTIFLRLLRRELPPELIKSPRAYLYRAAVNVSLTTIRTRKRHVLTDDAERLEAAEPPVDSTREADSGDSADSIEDLHKRLYEAIAELDPDAAQMLILRYVHNYSDADIARLLGKSRGVIAVRLFRLRARLKKMVSARSRAPKGEK